MKHPLKNRHSYKNCLDKLALEREGKLLLKEKKWTQAEHIFSRLIDHGDVFWVYMGKALLGQKKYKPSKECFEQVLPRAGSGVEWACDLFKGLGFCHYHLGDGESSLENFNKALSLIKNKFDPDISMGYGLLLKDQKKYQKAKEKFQMILEKDLKNADAWACLAEVRACIGDFELSYYNLQQALDLNPKNEQALKVKIRWSSQFQDKLGAKQMFSFHM